MATISRGHGYLSSESREAAFKRLVWRLDTPLGLAVAFSLALLIRLALAPYSGFYEDLFFFRTWATRLAAVGTHHFYTRSLFEWQSPGYLYVLWVLGKISSAPSYLLLKLPAIVADLGLAWVIGTFADRLAPESMKQRLPIRSLVTTIMLFNPVTFAVSAVWGQVDSIPVFFLVSALLLLFTVRPGRRHTVSRDAAAFALFAVSLAIKPQAAFVLPVMLYALYSRYLRGRRGAALGDGALAIGMSGVTSLGLWSLTGLPFGLGPLQLVRYNRQWAGIYPFTSLNAFNLWGIVGFRRNDANVNDPTGGHVVSVAGVSANLLGWLLFLVALGCILWRLHRALERGANEGRLLTMAAAVSALAGYVLLTRDHERYLFLPLMCLAPFVLVRGVRRWYVLLSGLFLFNLWFAYAFFNSRYSGVEDLRFQPWFHWLFGGLGTTAQTRVWSLAVTAVAAVVAYKGMRWAETRAPLSTQDRAAIAAPLPELLPPSTREPSPPALQLPESLRGWFAALERERGIAATGTARWGPRGLVALACVFGLVGLRAETTPAPNLNDSAFHLQMVRSAIGQIHEGRIPLDSWFPYLSLGSSFFHHYQSLSETLTAYVAVVTGASATTAFLWLLYLLLALWPISVYFGARLFGWERWVAASAAAVAPLLVSASGYGYEAGSYVWGGYGVYTQLWAMWTLPLAWGLTWQAISRGRRLTAAVIALALTMALHFITGYLAVLTVGVWLVVLGTSGFVRRVGRMALTVGASMLVAAWVLVPLLGDTKYTTQSEYYVGSIFNNSYGARRELGWLIDGSLFDYRRFPIVTLLFFIGLIACLVTSRRDLRARALLGAFTLSMLLWFGRATWGRLIDILPGFGDVQIHRFIMGVHLAGIFIAGVGLSWLLRAAFHLIRHRTPGRFAVAVAATAAVALVVGVLAPAWIERYHYYRHDAALIDAQRSYATEGADLDHLISIIKARGGGRVYAGLRSNWGEQYVVGYVPVYAWLADRDVDAIGFTFRTINSLSTDPEAAFEETNPAQYQMFNVRYLLLPADHPPPVPATLIASSGSNRLYGVKTTGYFQVVDRSAAIAENRMNIEQQSRTWRTSNLASQNIYPGVAFAGGPAPPPTFTGESPPPGAPGDVLAQSERLEDGVFTATVRARRPAVVLLKASYDPRWTATVDGVSTKPVMMAPSLVGVTVPQGIHAVQFHYEPYQHYPELLGVGALTLLGLMFVPRFVRRRRRPAEAAPEPR